MKRAIIHRIQATAFLAAAASTGVMAAPLYVASTQAQISNAANVEENHFGLYYNSSGSQGAQKAGAGWPAGLALNGSAAAKASATELGAKAVLGTQRKEIFNDLDPDDVYNLVEGANVTYPGIDGGYIYSHAKSVDFVSYEDSFTAKGNFYLDATVGVTFDPASFAAAVNAYVTRHGVTPGPDGVSERIWLGGGRASAVGEHFRYDTATCGSYGYNVVNSTLQYCADYAWFEVRSEYVVFADVYDATPTGYTLGALQDVGSFAQTLNFTPEGEAIWNFYDNESGSDPTHYGVDRNYPFDLGWQAGVTYGVNLSVFCQASGWGVMPYLPGFETGCVADQSAYWNGLTDIRDVDGNPLDSLGMTSASGFDYRYASPLSPAPAAVAPGIPEPSQWAMLIAGFGLVGGVARRRRAAGEHL